MHKIGSIKKINGKNFKAVDYKNTKKSAEKMAERLREKYKHVRMYKDGGKWYLYTHGEKKVISVYPNATVTEVRKNVKSIKGDPGVNRYIKGKFGYYTKNGVAYAIYIPSMKKSMKIMFKWSPRKKKWTSLTYVEGEL